jgi:hypothetical protein
VSTEAADFAAALHRAVEHQRRVASGRAFGQDVELAAAAATIAAAQRIWSLQRVRTTKEGAD